MRVALLAALFPLLAAPCAAAERTSVATLSRHRLQEREGRWVKLVASVVMIGLAIHLLWP